MSEATTTEAAAPAAPAENLTAVSAILGNEPAQAPAVDPAAPPADPAKTEGNPAADSVAMPGKDATPEQWAEFYNKLGRPEAADGYELPVPEGDDGAFAKQASAWMHEAGLSKEQGAKLAAKWNELAATQQAAQAKAEADAAQAQHVKNTAEAAELKTAWGQNFDANMHYAKQAATQFLPEGKAADVIAAVESKLGYKATIEFLHNIGKGLAEHDAAGLGSNNTGAPQKSLAERLYPTSSN